LRDWGAAQPAPLLILTEVEGLAFGPRSKRCAPEAAAGGRVFALRVTIAEAAALYGFCSHAPT